MSFGLFIGGIMAGFVAAWVISEKVKYEMMEKEWEAREITAREIKACEPVIVPTMTEEEFNTHMNDFLEGVYGSHIHLDSR